MGCRICGDSCSENPIGHYCCQSCGTYRWEATNTIAVQEHQVKLSGWVRKKNRNDIFPAIDDETIDRIVATPMPTVMQRADYILLEMEKMSPKIGEFLHTGGQNTKRLLRTSYFSENAQITYLIDTVLVAEGYAERTSAGIRTLPKGYIRIEELRKKQGGKNAFVAMWFGEVMNDAYEQGIEKGIKAAGYEAVRIDKKDHSNKIDDEIMVEIKSAAFVVADFTGQRGGVYFEAGYALGLGKPVIWTCRDAHLQDLHFDIRQYNCLTWKDAKFDEADKKNPPKDRKPYEAGDELDVFAENLKNRIMAAAGRGPSYSDTAIKNTT